MGRGDNKRRANELIAIATAGTATTINQHDFTRSNLDPLPIRRRYRRLPFESSLSLAVSSRRFPFLFLLLLAAAHTLNRVLNKRHVKRGGSWKRSVRRAEQSRGSSRVRVSRGGGGGRSSYRVRCIFIRPYIIPVHAAGQSRDLRLR